MIEHHFSIEIWIWLFHNHWTIYSCWKGESICNISIIAFCAIDTFALWDTKPYSECYVSCVLSFEGGFSFQKTRVHLFNHNGYKRFRWWRQKYRLRLDSLNNFYFNIILLQISLDITLSRYSKIFQTIFSMSYLNQLYYFVWSL